ncbi:insertion element IS476 uncharacterized 39.2 kDa protein (plasmid) [Arthrobacter sp. Hiyo8]|nr:insertion element IS476 uncharacterized 39.2 kDa protein [Arthrobacter sp. Hiyo8]
MGAYTELTGADIPTREAAVLAGIPRATATRRPHAPGPAPAPGRRRGTEAADRPVSDACGQLRFAVRRDLVPGGTSVSSMSSTKTGPSKPLTWSRCWRTSSLSTCVRCDNGPEFTAAALIGWCDTAGVDTAFIDPGSPWQNGFIESFNAQFRREQLSGEIMDTMAEAQYLAEEWKAIYNHERPHGSQDGMTPKRYWENWTQGNQLAIA